MTGHTIDYLLGLDTSQTSAKKTDALTLIHECIRCPHEQAVNPQHKRCKGHHSIYCRGVRIMYNGLSEYLKERERRKQAEREYWNRPHLQESVDPSSFNALELEQVRQVIETVKRGMEGGEIWNEKEKRYCRLVNYGVLEQAVDALTRYEKLLDKEPMVQQIANDWWKAGAFCDGPEGIV